MIDRKNDRDFEEFEERASDDTDEVEDGAGADVQTALTNAVASTSVDFSRLGITEMAYIRETVVNDLPMWGIFSAAGDPLGAAASFDQALAAVQQHDLRPMRVH